VTRLYADHGWGSRIALADPAMRVLPANLSLDAHGFVGPPEDFLPRVRWRPGAGMLVEPVDADGVARAARGAGLGFTVQEVGGLHLFVHAPRPRRPGRPVPAAELVATAFRRSEAAGLALDGNRRTAWATGRALGAEDWFRVDLPAPRAIRAVRGPAPWPRGLVLEGSVDGATWHALSAEPSTDGRLRWGGIALLRDGVEAVRFDFAPAVLSALRLRPTRGDPDAEWAIGELSVLAAE
jgi:hypothetical protein